MFEGNGPAERKECLLCSSSFAPNMMLAILEVTQLLWLQLNWKGRINWWQFLKSFWSIHQLYICCRLLEAAEQCKNAYMQQAQCHYQPAASLVSFSSFQCNQIYFSTLPKHRWSWICLIRFVRWCWFDTLWAKLIRLWPHLMHAMLINDQHPQTS
jgi:hypothetical protein